MDLAISTKTFDCTIDDGLAHIVLNQPDRGNPIDGEFCREFNLCIAEISERTDVRSVLLSARGRLFSVGGDLVSLVKQGDALPRTIKNCRRPIGSAPAKPFRPPCRRKSRSGRSDGSAQQTACGNKGETDGFGDIDKDV